MAIERGQSLQRGTRSTKVTNQFGVVRSEAPRFGEALGSFAEAATKYTEFQIKIIDEQWKTDFKTKTSQYFSELDNKYLNSPNPDMASLKADITGYRDKIIDSAPKRFENLASGYIDQNSLDTFNRVKNYSNKLIVKNLYDSRAIDMLSIQSNIQKNLIALDDVFFDSIEAKEGSINTKEEAINLAVFKATPDISDLSEKLMLLKEIDPLRYGNLQELEDLNSVFFNAEVQRVTALTSMYYDDVDFKDQESVREADNKLDNFLNDYLNGDTFKAAENLSPNDYDDIVKSSLDRKKDIKNYNDDLIKQGIKNQKLKNFDYVNKIINSSRDISNTNIENGGYIFGNNTNPSMEDIASYFYDRDIDVSNTTVEKIYDNLRFKKKILSLEEESIKDNIPLGNLLNSPNNEDLIKHFGSASKAIEELLSKNENIYSVEQLNKISESGYFDTSDNPDDFSIENSLNAQQKAGILTPTWSAYFNQMNYINLQEGFQGTNKEQTARKLEYTYNAWKKISNNGSIEYSEIDEDTLNLFTRALSLENGSSLGPMDLSSKLIKEYNNNISYGVDVSKGEKPRMKNNVLEFFEVGEDGTPEINVFDGPGRKNIIDLIIDQDTKVYVENRDAPYKYFKGDPKYKKMVVDLRSEYKPYLKTLEYNKDEIMMKIMDRVNNIADEYTNKKDLKNIYNTVAVNEVKKFIYENKSNGMTRYKSGSFHEKTFTKNSLEKNHNLNEVDAELYSLAYLDGVLNSNWESMKDAFLVIGEQADKPDRKRQVEMIRNGNIEFEWIGGEGEEAEYQLKFNFDDNILYDANEFVVSDLFPTLNGEYFNPTKIKGATTSYESVKQQVIDEILNTSKPENELETSGRYGLGIVVPELDEFFNYDGFLGKMLRAGDWLGLDIGSDKIFKENAFGKYSFSTIQKQGLEKLTDKIFKSINDAAYKFVQKTNDLISEDDSSTIDNAKTLHKQIYSFDESLENSLPKKEISDNDYLDARNSLSTIDYFREGYSPYQRALLIDAVVYYNPDIDLLNKFTKNGDIKLIDKLFPTMNNYHKDIMRNSFGR